MGGVGSVLVAVEAAVLDDDAGFEEAVGLSVVGAELGLDTPIDPITT